MSTILVDNDDTQTKRVIHYIHIYTVQYSTSQQRCHSLKGSFVIKIIHGHAVTIIVTGRHILDTFDTTLITFGAINGGTNPHTLFIVRIALNVTTFDTIRATHNIGTDIVGITPLEGITELRRGYTRIRVAIINVTFGKPFFIMINATIQTFIFVVASTITVRILDTFLIIDAFTLDGPEKDPFIERAFPM